ncbi:MAG: hypothetical protein KC464_00120 [Myxococcales bacterium]|nr:hypothetical protein [Myxococcales bacterium]
MSLALGCRKPPPIRWRDATTAPPEALDRLAATVAPLLRGTAERTVRDYFGAVEDSAHQILPADAVLARDLQWAYDDARKSLEVVPPGRRLTILQRLAYRERLSTLYSETAYLVARRIELDFPVTDWELDGNVIDYFTDAPKIDLDELRRRTDAAKDELARLARDYGGALGRERDCRVVFDTHVAQIRTQIRNTGGDWSFTTSPFYDLLKAHGVDTHMLAAEVLHPYTRGCSTHDPV